MEPGAGDGMEPGAGDGMEPGIDIGDIVVLKPGEKPGILFVPETTGPLPICAPYTGDKPLLDPTNFFKALIPVPPSAAAILARFAVFNPVSILLFNPEI